VAFLVPGRQKKHFQRTGEVDELDKTEPNGEIETCADERNDEGKSPEEV
jgi:hypothetical protein